MGAPYVDERFRPPHSAGRTALLVVTGVTNARTEAANTTNKNIKRTGQAFKNPANHKARILLRSAETRAA